MVLTAPLIDGVRFEGDAPQVGVTLVSFIPSVQPSQLLQHNRYVPVLGEEDLSTAGVTFEHKQA